MEATSGLQREAELLNVYSERDTGRAAVTTRPLGVVGTDREQLQQHRSVFSGEEVRPPDPELILELNRRTFQPEDTGPFQSQEPVSDPISGFAL